jgi:hypothetical protein
VGAIAKRLVPGKPATAKRDGGAAAKPEVLALLVDQLKIPFNAKRTVVENGYLSSSHRFLRDLAKTMTGAQGNSKITAAKAKNKDATTKGSPTSLR